MGKWRKKGFALLKILFSALLLYLVFTRIPFSQVWAVLKNADLVFIGLALLFFIASKVLSAYRLNLYFHQIGVPLPQGSNLRLYLLGMFYNLFLPGGIGGDAYKGYLVHKTFGTGGKRLAAVLLLDRLSGMLLLFVYNGILPRPDWLDITSLLGCWGVPALQPTGWDTARDLIISCRYFGLPWDIHPLYSWPSS